MFMSKPQMKEFAEDRGMGIYEMIKWTRNVAAVRAELARVLDRIEYGIVDESDDEADSGFGGENKYIVEFLRSAYMKPLKQGSDEGRSKYTTHGQRVEGKFLEVFFELSNDVSSGVMWMEGVDSSIEAVYIPGLVCNDNRAANKRRIYLRDSADGVAIERDLDADPDEGNVYRAIPIEIKSRCVLRTFHRERQYLLNAMVSVDDSR